MGAAAGKGRPKLKTNLKGKPRPRNEREQTPPMKRTGTDVPPKLDGRGKAPNGLKLSDGGWRRKMWNTEKTPPPASVRWSALLGTAPTERAGT